jgi:hypothetical protein
VPAERFRTAAGVPMTVSDAPESDMLQASDVTVEQQAPSDAAAQEAHTEDMLTEEEKAGLSLLDLWLAIRLPDLRFQFVNTRRLLPRFHRSKGLSPLYENRQHSARILQL